MTITERQKLVGYTCIERNKTDESQNSAGVIKHLAIYTQV